MQFSGPNPFSEPLAKYLNRYSIEAMDYFMKHIQLSRYLRTPRNIWRGDMDPNLQRELSARTSAIVTDYLRSINHGYVISGLQLCLDLATIFPNWTIENPYAINARLHIWRLETPPAEEAVIPFDLSRPPMTWRPKQFVVRKALELLRPTVSKGGWTDITVKLNYLSRQSG